MFLYRQQTRRLLAIGLGVCLALASVGPSVAIACEGGGEEPQNISLKPIVWSGGGACPEKEGKVHFTVVKQWCEYEVKNENEKENVTLENSGQTQELGCVFLEALCLEGRAAAKEPECKKGGELAAKGGKCYAALEYFKKPAGPEEMGSWVKTKSAPGNVLAKVEVHQIVE